MHSLNEQLLYLRQFDGLLVAAFALHTGRDTANDDDGVGYAHFFGKVGEVGQLALANVAAQHGELSVAATVLDDHVVVLTLFDVERLVFGTPASEAEATAWTTSLVLLDDLTIHFQDVAVVGTQGVLHLTRERSGVLTADAHGEVIVADALGKAPGTKGREVQLVVVAALLGVLEVGVPVVPELYEHALAVVEVLQVVDSGILIVQFTSLLIDDLGVGQGSLDAAE